MRWFGEEAYVKGCLHVAAAAAALFIYWLQVDFNLVGMGWLKLRQVLLREDPQQQQQHALGPQDTPTTPAAADGRRNGNSSSSSTVWDPWRADSEVHIAYELQQQQQQGSAAAAAAGGSLGFGSSQAPEGSAAVWDSSNTPQEWDWNTFAAAEGCR
jgi:hypothetical protein